MSIGAENEGKHPSRARLAVGGIVFVAGQLSPLLIPLVVASDLPGAVKATLSGLLVLGVPELASVAAAAILGKEGFHALKGLIADLFKKHGPPEEVSRSRYRAGLVMFTLALVLGWAAPYWGHLIPGWKEHPYAWSAAGDLTLILSLFVLGGEFWDKLRALFIHGAKASFPS